MIMLFVSFLGTSHIAQQFDSKVPSFGIESTNDDVSQASEAFVYATFY